MKTYIVNLSHCQDRRENILKECAKFDLNPEIITGVYGKNLTETELRARVSEAALEIFSKSEIGCCLSHLGIYRDMIDNNIPVALILEDDSVFTMDPRGILDSKTWESTDSPNVYLLTHQANIYIDDGGGLQIGNFQFFRGWRAFGAYGYIITKNAAANLLALQEPMKFACDWWKVFQSYDLIRLFLCKTEIIGQHSKLSQISLLDDRPPDKGHRRKIYVLKQTPFRYTAKYYCRKLYYWFNLRG